MRAFDGEIISKSEVGKGTEFEMKFPNSKYSKNSLKQVDFNSFQSVYEGRASKPLLTIS